jgi:hypothetical protein
MGYFGYDLRYVYGIADKPTGKDMVFGKTLRFGVRLCPHRILLYMSNPVGRAE